MTKKHQTNYSKFVTSRHSPSSASSHAGISPEPSTSPRSVNERLNQLRREQAPRASTERRDEVITSLTQRTIPPALRRILNLPESAPPPSRARPRGRRVPGPPAPRSWLHASRHAPHNTKEADPSVIERRVGEFSSLSMLKDAPISLPKESSLLHIALKSFALNWGALVEYEQFNLPTLPITIRTLILSYIGVFGDEYGLELAALKLLYPEDVEHGAGDDLQQLDLSNLLGESLTLSSLNRFLFRPKKDALSPQPLGPEIQAAVPADDTIAESWETEANNIQLDVSLSTAKFSNLTRLSLFNPGSQASWPHLLQLSHHLSTLTHLSLGYWPRPSATPRAMTTSMASRHTGPINFGGTDFYSDMDDDFYEAANILRRLSKTTYCLKWLDLEGCDWSRALVWGRSLPQSRITHPSRNAFDDMGSSQSEIGPDWNGAWAQIEYLNLSQGWIPHDTDAIRQLPAGLIAGQLLTYLRFTDDIALDRSNSVPVSERNIRYWLEHEKQAREAERTIRAFRTSASGRYCKVDHGWVPPVAANRSESE